MVASPLNRRIAERLGEMADLLERQEADEGTGIETRAPDGDAGRWPGRAA